MLSALTLVATRPHAMPYAAFGAEPLPLRHFPSPLHACVWRNWLLTPVDRLAEVVGARPGDIVALGRRMGLSGPPAVSRESFERSYVSLIRANWHLLPDDQMLALLGWTPERYAFTLREDDFLYGKMGVRPNCPPVRYADPTPAMRRREDAIAALVRTHFPGGAGLPEEPLFAFIEEFSRPGPCKPSGAPSRFHPRFTYSYFAVYGDVLLDADPFPDGMLARLASAGVDGVWLQAVLHKLAPFPWDLSWSEQHGERLANLRGLIERARSHGIGVYLYLNEPRSMPLNFFEGREHIRGAEEAGFARLCTSVPEVQDYLREAVAHVCREAPGLAGFFTITVGENRTICWSHLDATGCPRCSVRAPEEVVAEACALIQDGIDRAGSDAALIVWDWVWPDAWVEGIIDRLPAKASLMSVSEWDLPINRGGGPVRVTEYAMSAVGPSDRARRHWAMARGRGLGIIAKVQASTTWELSTVPYIPAFRNVAEHMGRLRDVGVDGLMLSWTLGAYPSAGYEIVAAMGGEDSPDPAQAMLRVARRGFGDSLAPAVVRAWEACSEVLKAYPFHNHPIYLGPVQVGPANLLWERPTGYRATMVGFPYDDLSRWRAMYAPEVFAAQYAKVADGFDAAASALSATASAMALSSAQESALGDLLDVTRTCAIHFRSTANQARFILLRRELEETRDTKRRHETQPPDESPVPGFSGAAALAVLDQMEAILNEERDLAIELHAIQSRDSRIGFEASNQYHYTPMDLVEKVLNVEDMVSRYLRDERLKNAYSPNWWEPA